MLEHLSDWEVPPIEIPSLDLQPMLDIPDLFAEKKRKHWHEENVAEARCDMKPCIRLTRRGVFFTSVWKKSIYGRTLSDLKADADMVEVFASAIVPVIKGVVGDYLDPRHFAIVCSPRRRHLGWNFAHHTACLIGSHLGLPFFSDCCTARSRQRINVDFDAANVPEQKNIIVYDDIVTTGQTLSAMRRLLHDSLGKNCIFFANINNSL